MQFESKPKGTGGSGAGSYEQPPVGPDGKKKYPAVLVGFSLIGTQPSDYKASLNVRLLWQLFVRDPEDRTRLVPSVDSKGFAHTIGQNLTATLGEGSHLRSVVEALSGIGKLGETEKSDRTDSKNWLGRAALLDLTQNGDYVNVERSKTHCGVSSLDLEYSGIKEYPIPTIPAEHWDDEDAQAGRPAPQWARLWLGKSGDYKQFGDTPAPKGNGNGHQQQAGPAPAPAAAPTDFRQPLTAAETPF
jgi:hypothetical protein